MTTRSQSQPRTASADARTPKRSAPRTRAARRPRYCDLCVSAREAIAQPLSVGGVCERCGDDVFLLYAVSKEAPVGETLPERMHEMAVEVLAARPPSRLATQTAYAMALLSLEFVRSETRG